MQPQEFLAAVLPSTGVYCIAELTSKKKEHVFATNLGEFQHVVDKWVKDRRDVYFALATFKEEGNRTAKNAEFIRAAFLDMDGYETKRDAAEALDVFLEKTDLAQLGQPLVVDSGGGLHVYWPFTEDVPIDVWKPVAENLKRLCAQENMRIDNTVTADAARVLRIPGTVNFKPKYPKPRAVRVMVEAKPKAFDFGTFSGQLIKKLNGHAYSPVLPQKIEIEGERPKGSRTETSVKLFDNLQSEFKLLWIKTIEGTGCKQLEYYKEHATEDGMEPLWRGLLSWTTRCTDGGDYASRISEMHPYDEDRMRQKLRDIKGPYPCVKMDSENPGVCTKCPHWGKITNPLTLCRTVATDNTEKQIEIQDEEEPVAVQIVRPAPPRGYSYGAKGGIFADKILEDDQGNKSKKSVMILPYTLFAVDILKQPTGEHVVHMIAEREDEYHDVLLNQKSVVSKDETVKTLAAQNIIASFGSGNDKNLFEYVRGCVENASISQSPLVIPSNYGWQNPDRLLSGYNAPFVHGGMVYQNGTARRVPMPDLQNITSGMRSMGTIEGWRNVIQVLIDKGLDDILAMLCVGLGSPFMAFSKLAGMTFHLGSTESGTGKSLALRLAASVWGHPDHFRVSRSTSDVAMVHHAGMLNSQPLISDEITVKNRRDFEWFPAMVFDISEGRGKERMESGANKERLNTTTWALLALMASNTHVVDYMTGNRKHSSEGELRRVLELTLTDILTWDDHEREAVVSLSQNYGVVGPQYAKWLSQSGLEAQKLYKKIEKHIRMDFRSPDDERFWTAGCASCIAGAVALGSKHMGIIDLPVERIMRVFRNLVFKSRETVKSSKRTVEDVLNSYTREFYGKFVVIKVVDGTLAATLGDGGVVDETISRSEIAGRVEHGVTPGHIEYSIEENLLKSYCASMSFGYADFKKQIERIYRVAYGKMDLMKKTRGPSMRVNAIKISMPEIED